MFIKKNRIRLSRLTRELSLSLYVKGDVISPGQDCRRDELCNVILLLLLVYYTVVLRAYFVSIMKRIAIKHIASILHYDISARVGDILFQSAKGQRLYHRIGETSSDLDTSLHLPYYNHIITSYHRNILCALLRLYIAVFHGITVSRTSGVRTICHFVLTRSVGWKMCVNAGRDLLLFVFNVKFAPYYTISRRTLYAYRYVESGKYPSHYYNWQKKSNIRR